MNNQTKSKSCCDRCGKEVAYPFQLSELKETYQLPNIKSLCDDCGTKANSFASYYGEKKAQHLHKLKSFLLSGTESNKRMLNKYSAQSNGGYYV